VLQVWKLQVSGSLIEEGRSILPSLSFSAWSLGI
jgi:hypothetical protein